MATFKRSYLPSQSQPWAKQVEDKVDATERSLKSLDVNNRSKDEQFSASLNRLDAAVIDARAASELADAAQIAATSANTTAIDANTLAGTANTNALSAIADVVGLSSSGGTTINADNISGGTISGNFITGGTIDGVSITGGDLNTTSVGGLSVQVSGSSALFKSGGTSVGQVSADSAGRLLVSGNSGLYLNAGASGTTNFGSGGFTVGDSANLTVQGRIISAGTYNAVASSTANLLINSNNYFQRTTSSRRYKSDIQDIDYGMKALELRPRTWVDKSAYEENDNSTDGLTRITGFIAEEIHDLGLTELVQYNEEGLPEAVNYDRLMVGVIPILKQQQQLIETLITRIEALEAK